MFKSKFIFLVLNILFLFLLYSMKKKGISRRRATKTRKTNTHSGFDFLRLQQQKVERNLLVFHVCDGKKKLETVILCSLF